MIGRLLSGLLLGFMAGAAVAFGLARGFAVLSFQDSALLAYAATAVTGVLTGLVAGRPFWAKGAMIESILKSVFGALLATGGLYALRTWGGGLSVPMTWLDPSLHGPLASIPAGALPAVGGVLGGLFGLDNTDAPATEAKGKRVATSEKRVTTGADEPEAGDEEESTRRARR